MSRKRLFFTVLLFIIIGLLSDFLLWRIPTNDAPLAILAPVLTFAYQLEKWLPIIRDLTAIQNEFALIVPAIVVYFGLIGLWIAKIWREEGFYKLVTLLCLAGFVAVIHWQAFTYLKSLISA